MKGFIQEYGNIIVVVAVILLMLLFGKTGFAKNIQDAILGSANHIVETGENIVPKQVKASDTIDIEGTEYVVLEERGNNQALVMTVRSIWNRTFQSSARTDGQNQSTYEGSEIDNYLENNWYKGLSAKMRNAIQPTSIKQASYATYNDPDSKQETGYNGQVYNTIDRHVFLPSVSEIGKAVDLKNNDKVKAFLHVEYMSIWTRDSYQDYADVAEYLDSGYGGLGNNYVNATNGVRPAFVIDLSQVNYTVTGHTDYK